VLPAGWFYDRLAERLARRANDAALVARIQEQAAVRVDRQFVRSHRLTLVELGAMAVGTVVCVLLWFRRNESSSFVRLHEPGVPPPWPGGIGAAVLLRGGAIGAMLTALFLIYAPPDNVALRAVAIPMTNVPLLLLAYRHLFRPSGMTFDDGFGLAIGWARVGRLVTAVLAVVAAGFAAAVGRRLGAAFLRQYLSLTLFIDGHPGLRCWAETAVPINKWFRHDGRRYN
jgi:hypothetical protein